MRDLNTTTDLIRHLREIDSRRVVILGTSGSGKSTLARKLTQVLNVPRIELDALYAGHKPGSC